MGGRVPAARGLKGVLFLALLWPAEVLGHVTVSGPAAVFLWGSLETTEPEYKVGCFHPPVRQAGLFKL